MSVQSTLKLEKLKFSAPSSLSDGDPPYKMRRKIQQQHKLVLIILTGYDTTNSDSSSEEEREKKQHNNKAVEIEKRSATRLGENGSGWGPSTRRRRLPPSTTFVKGECLLLVAVSIWLWLCVQQESFYDFEYVLRSFIFDLVLCVFKCEHNNGEQDIIIWGVEI